MGANQGSLRPRSDARPTPASAAAPAPYVGRFAPSPTGALHFGSLIAAVASYADARAAGGHWLLRIEDVDAPRCSGEAEREILRQLAACGFEPDGPVTRQSERHHHYEAALARLVESGQVFACGCSRSTLADAPRNSEGETIYPGTCRNRHLALGEHALRLRTASRGDIEPTICFTDRSCVEVRQDVSADVGDFVLKRADGLFAYQLAVVVDDALQGVTDVVRGADLLMNTPRQMLLQRQLGFGTPRYLHVPLARNAAGEKLSKQTRAAAIATSADTVLPALHEAWAFLRQQPMGRVETVAAFWRLAAERWQVPALTPTSPQNL